MRKQRWRSRPRTTVSASTPSACKNSSRRFLSSVRLPPSKTRRLNRQQTGSLRLFTACMLSTPRFLQPMVNFQVPRNISRFFRRSSTARNRRSRESDKLRRRLQLQARHELPLLNVLPRVLSLLCQLSSKRSPRNHSSTRLAMQHRLHIHPTTPRRPHLIHMRQRTHSRRLPTPTHLLGINLLNLVLHTVSLQHMEDTSHLSSKLRSPHLREQELLRLLLHRLLVPRRLATGTTCQKVS